MTSQKGYSFSKLNCEKHDEVAHFRHYAAEQASEDSIYETGAGVSKTEDGLQINQVWGVQTWTKRYSEEGDL